MPPPPPPLATLVKLGAAFSSLPNEASGGTGEASDVMRLGRGGPSRAGGVLALLLLLLAMIVK